MDSFFGIGPAELIVIMFLAGVVMGPKRIRQVAFWLGKVTAQLQAVSRGFTRQLNQELSALDEESGVADAWGEMQDLRRQLADLKKEITFAASQPIKEGQQAIKDGQRAIQDARDAVDNTISPPQIGQEQIVDQEKPAKKQEADVKETELQEPSQNGTPAGLPNLVEVSDDPE